MPDAAPPKSFAAKLAELVPFMSVAALVLVTVFNFGYFSKVGFHFLGVMDFSNLAYSFSFFFSLIAGSLGLYFVGAQVDWLSKVRSNPNYRRDIKNWMFGMAGLWVIIILIFAYFVPEKYVPKTFGPERIMASVFGPLTLGILAMQFADYQHTRKISARDVFSCTLVGFFLIYMVGRAVAEYHIFNNSDTYTFILKDGAPLTGRLVRSSSSGFIAFIDNKVTFIPQAEVKRVQSASEIKLY